jgi:hypothetical protein
MVANNMTSPLNSPVEVGVRILIVLAEAFPAQLGINELVLLDHALLHSGDLGGPPSIHPPLPGRVGELGFKRTLIEYGIQLMLRAELIESSASPSGLQFVASDAAASFVGGLTSLYARTLIARTQWVVEHFDDLTEQSLRTRMRAVFESWAEEFVLSESGGSP